MASGSITLSPVITSGLIIIGTVEVARITAVVSCSWANSLQQHDARAILKRRTALRLADVRTRESNIQSHVIKTKNAHFSGMVLIVFNQF
jgi:hypothetical protein